MSECATVQADAICWMKEQESSCFDLIIADPPYNVGKDYGAMRDQKEKQAYLDFTREWTKEAKRLLKPDGTIYVFMGFKYISHLYCVLENECGLHFNSWISWHYTQGQGRRRGFSARHDDILMFTMSKEFTFNLDEIRVPQKYYRSVNNMRGANPGDVWEFSHVHYCQENRQDHPSQKPEGLVERMVLASSHQGDRVLDPFCGSGTTLRVCQQLNRHCIGIEISREYVEIAEKRLQEPFRGFDSVDPRMKRIPLNFNDAELREKYIENHIEWFLSNHDVDVAAFRKEVQRIYGDDQTNGGRKRRGERNLARAELFPVES